MKFQLLWAEFYFYIVKDFIKNLFHFLRFCHKTAASCLVGDSRKRTAHIEVYLLVTHRLTLLRETYYLVSIVAENLWR